MMQIGPPLQPPPASGGSGATPLRTGAPPPIPVQLVQPTTLPENLPANSTLPAIVEPGGQAGVGGDLVVVRTAQGIISFLSPVALAAGTSVMLQTATIAGRVQLLLVPPKPVASDTPPGDSTIAHDSQAAPAAPSSSTAKPNLDPLLPGRVLTATVVRAGIPPRGATPAAPPPGTNVAPANTVGTVAPSDGVAAPALAESTGNQPAVPASAGSVPTAAPQGAAGAPASAVAVPSDKTIAPAPPGSGETLAPSPNATVPTAAAAMRAAALPAPAEALPPFAGMAQGEQLTVKIVSVAAAPTAPQGQAAQPVQSLGNAASASAAPVSGTPQNSAKAPPPSGAPTAAAGQAAPSNAAPTAAPTASIPGPVPIASAAPATAAQPAPAAATPTNPAGPIQAAGAAPVAAFDAAPIEVATNVIGNDAAGQPIVRAGSVLLVLDAAAPPVGTEIVLAVQRSATAPAASAPLPTAPFEALAQDAAAQPGPLRQAVTALMPRPGPALAAQLALYLQAARQSSASAWLGSKAIDQLEKLGKGRSAQRLGAALGELAAGKGVADRGNSWLSLTLPLADSGLIQPIQLYVQRRDDDEEKEERPDSGQGKRFLIDFTLTRLGGIQLDGLARANRLDLIMRTSGPVDPTLRGELDRLFADVMSARGLAGTLVFQVAPPVTPVQRQKQQVSAAGILV